MLALTGYYIARNRTEATDRGNVADERVAAAEIGIRAYEIDVVIASADADRRLEQCFRKVGKSEGYLGGDPHSVRLAKLDRGV